MAAAGTIYSSSSLTRPILWTEPTGYGAESACGYYWGTATAAAERSSKRQAFLRSYQFRRKRSLPERIRRCLVRVKRLVWFRLRSGRRLRRFVWAKLWKLRQGFHYRRRPSRFVRLVGGNYYYHSNCDSFPCF